MAKSSGGTRNYSSRQATLAKRRKEFDNLMATGDYVYGYFDESGGYFVVHKDHNLNSAPELNKENAAGIKLAKKGYRLYLMGEKSFLLLVCQEIFIGTKYKKKQGRYTSLLFRQLLVRITRVWVQSS